VALAVGDHRAGMGATARRVRAERKRARLPHRSATSRWSRRLIGLLATAAFLTVGVVSAKMIVPDKDKSSASATTAVPTPTTVKTTKKSAKHKAKAKPKAPTKTQLAARSNAVAAIRQQGYTALKLSDYDFKATLRVLIARPVGDSGGGSYAFFFNKSTLLGKDSTSPSTKITVAKQSTTQVTLAYETSAGRQKVRFKLNGATLEPRDPIPPAGERLTPRTN
jgi:hypothetical protein